MQPLNSDPAAVELCNSTTLQPQLRNSDSVNLTENQATTLTLDSPTQASHSAVTSTPQSPVRACSQVLLCASYCVYSTLSIHLRIPPYLFQAASPKAPLLRLFSFSAYPKPPILCRLPNTAQ